MWSKTDSNRIDVLCGIQLVLGYFLHKATKSIHEVINFLLVEISHQLIGL